MAVGIRRCTRKKRSLGQGYVADAYPSNPFNGTYPKDPRVCGPYGVLLEETQVHKYRFLKTGVSSRLTPLVSGKNLSAGIQSPPSPSSLALDEPRQSLDCESWDQGSYGCKVGLKLSERLTLKIFGTNEAFQVPFVERDPSLELVSQAKLGLALPWGMTIISYSGTLVRDV